MGEEIIADHYFAGQFVDIAGTSIGKGFARCDEAPQLRWSARLARRVDQPPLARFDRPVRDPGKVFKGKKMAGHLGAVRVTTQNLQVVRTDADRGLIMVKGSGSGLERWLGHHQGRREEAAGY